MPHKLAACEYKGSKAEMCLSSVPFALKNQRTGLTSSRLCENFVYAGVKSVSSPAALLIVGSAVSSIFPARCRIALCPYNQATFIKPNSLRHDHFLCKLNVLPAWCLLAQKINQPNVDSWLLSKFGSCLLGFDTHTCTERTRAHCKT